MTNERLEELRQIAGGIGGPKSGFMDELIDEIDRLRADNDRLRAENCKLHVALFHIENGLSHPDESVRKLIQAAMEAEQ